MQISSILRKVCVGAFTLLATSLALPSMSHAQTEFFDWTSDHCTGGCIPSGTVTVTQSGNTLTFVASLGDSLNYLGGNGAGIGATFAFDLTGVSSVTFSAITDSGQTFTTFQNSSVMMDGAGSFTTGVICSSCGPGASGPTAGSTISFSITGTGLSLASLGGIMAADVVSCSATTAGCTGTGNGNTGVIDATLRVPGPIVGAGLPGLVMACSGLVVLARRRREKIV